MLLVLLASVLLTACSDTPATPPPPTVLTRPPTTGGNGNATAPGTPEPIPAAGSFDYKPDQNFIFGLRQEPVAFGQVGFDPANLTDQSSLVITRQIYETLFEFEPSNSMQYQYGDIIYQGIGDNRQEGVQILDEGKTYLLRIKKGLQFSEGSPIGTPEVAWNFKRWSEVGNIYHKGDFSTWQTYFGGFPGNLVSATALDDRTVEIKLREPMAAFFQVLAMPQFGLVSPTAFDQTGNLKPGKAGAIGSGPYAVEKLVTGSEKNTTSQDRYVTLTRNPNYEHERDTRILPARKIERLVAKVLRGNQDGLVELKAGRISATDKIRPEDVAQNLNDQLFEVKRRTPLNVAYLAFNSNREPFDQPAVRQALALSINLPELVKTAYNGLALPATSFLPPATLGYRSLSAPEYNLNKAKQLLAQAGYADPTKLPPIDLWVLPVPRLYYPDADKVANAIVSDLAKLGVTVVKRTEDWVSFRKDRADGNFAMFLGGWQGENGDPDEFLYSVFGNENRELGYNNEVVRRLLYEARQLTLGDAAASVQRNNLYKEAIEIIIREVYVAPLAYTDWPVAVRRDVQNFVPNPSGIESWAALNIVK